MPPQNRRAFSAAPKPVKQIKHYSYGNPPANLAIATAKLDYLSPQISIMEVKLDHNQPEDFRTDAEYDTWRQSAMIALGYHLAEERFLLRWVKEQTSAQPNPQHARARSEAANRIRDRGRALAEEIRREYPRPLYFHESPPPSASAARMRLSKLAEIRRRLMNALSEITDLWATYPLRRADMPSAVRPLNIILNMVNGEIGDVNRALERPLSSVR